MWGVGPSVDIHEAAAFGNIEAIKQHLAADVDVNAKDRMGWTPLCEAAINGHKEIAELLLANGADVNVKDDRGMTPLDWAIKQIFSDAPQPRCSTETHRSRRPPSQTRRQDG